MHGSPGFSGELGNYCICLCEKRLCSTKSYCMPSVRSESQEWCRRMNKHWHTLEAYRLSSLYQKYSFHPRQLGRSSSSPWKVNSPLACLASTLERQKRHSEVVIIACHWLCSTLVQLYIFLCATVCKLSLHVMINQFTERITEFFMHAQTMFTRHSLWFFQYLEMRLSVPVL